MTLSIDRILSSNILNCINENMFKNFNNQNIVLKVYKLELQKVQIWEYANNWINYCRCHQASGIAANTIYVWDYRSRWGVIYNYILINGF